MHDMLKQLYQQLINNDKEADLTKVRQPPPFEIKSFGIDPDDRIHLQFDIRFRAPDSKQGKLLAGMLLAAAKVYSSFTD